MSNKKLIVTKASGSQDLFSADKLRRSLIKSGAGEQVADDILKQVSSIVYNGIPTKKIYQAAYVLLKKNSKSQAGRYNLKRAIMALGPSGYPFEKYIASIFEWQGYTVKVKEFMAGICVMHEVDVLAENELHVLVIECKYHNSQGIFSDVKVPLYINSRYLDLLGQWNKKTVQKPLDCWVVTNTKFSTDAIKYGVCAGLHMLGWNYPDNKSLSKLVDDSGLYPVTCLTTLTNREKELVVEAGIVICKNLLSKRELLQNAGISPNRIAGIFAEIEELCK